MMGLLDNKLIKHACFRGGGMVGVEMRLGRCAVGVLCYFFFGFVVSQWRLDPVVIKLT